MAKTKQAIPGWIRERVRKTNVRLVGKIYSSFNSVQNHAMVELLEPVEVFKWVCFRIRDKNGPWLYNGIRYNRKREIVTLRLPIGARVVVHSNASKCRTDVAKYTGKKSGFSGHDRNFKYIPGRIVRSKLSAPTNTCGKGIHFCFRKGQVRFY